MYSFVIKIAKEVNRAVLLEMIIPTLGLTIDRVEVVIVETDPNKISEIFINTIFLLKPLYFFLY